jgi:hypothetical protein
MEEEEDGGVVVTARRGVRAVSVCARSTPRMSGWCARIAGVVYTGTQKQRQK